MFLCRTRTGRTTHTSQCGRRRAPALRKMLRRRSSLRMRSVRSCNSRDVCVTQREVPRSQQFPVRYILELHCSTARHLFDRFLVEKRTPKELAGRTRKDVQQNEMFFRFFKGSRRTARTMFVQKKPSLGGLCVSHFFLTPQRGVADCLPSLETSS